MTSEGENPNFKEGRPPKYDEEQLYNAMHLLEDHSYAQVVKLTKISKSTLVREKKKRQMCIMENDVMEQAIQDIGPELMKILLSDKNTKDLSVGEVTIILTMA